MLSLILGINMTTAAIRHTGHDHPRPRSAAIVDDIVTQLAQRGYRDTYPRRLVISAATAHRRPFTAEELCVMLPCVGRATVYRGLRLLVDTGLLCRVLLEDGEMRYQLSHDGHHHHLLCVTCGVSTDLAGCDVEGLLQNAAYAAGFQMSGHWLEVYGRCGECAIPDAG